MVLLDCKRQSSLLALCASTLAMAEPLPASGMAPRAVTNDWGSERHGGRLVVTLRSEPTTLNPLLARQISSRTILNLIMADLIHINRATQKTEPSLASSWRSSEDGRSYRLQLRKGIRFSDGHPVDADDVVFTFAAHLDEELHSAQRDLLVVDGHPIRLEKLDSRTILFELAAPYAAAERLFDSIAILPAHRLEKPYREGRLLDMWGLSDPGSDVVGLGPFRLKEYVLGERVVLERNPFYWKRDPENRRLPYLEELVLLLTPGDDAEVLRFQTGDAHVIQRLSPHNYRALQADAQSKSYRMRDLGPGLEYNFLFFNQNELKGSESPPVKRARRWFRNTTFRRAVSAAIDRRSIVELVYLGRASPLSSHVTPGDRLWLNDRLEPQRYSLRRSRQLFREAGFRFAPGGQLVDAANRPVEFSLLTSAGNSQRVKTASLIQEDLRKVGISVHVVPLDFGAVVERVFRSRDYEACLLALQSGDADPTPAMDVWMSNGASHLWRLDPEAPVTEWQAEIDELMREQMTTLDRKRRKKLYDRVQEIVAEQLPIIPLVSPNILAAADSRLRNFRPAVMDHYTLWNAEELYFER